jgi:hypothetical protein
MLPHGLIRINMKIILIANNYIYLSHVFYLLNILKHNDPKIHRYYRLVGICLLSHNFFHIA